MTKEKTPSDCIKALYQRISFPQKTAFAAAVLVGFAAHLYQFTNKLYNYDELVNTPGGYGIGAELGRWFLQLMAKVVSAVFRGNYSLPLLTGILSLLLLAAAAMLLVEIFHVKDGLSAALIGGLSVAFPSVTCMYFFMFTAIFYAIGNFMSILAAYLAIKYPKSIPAHAAAVVLLACSLGTYQAYFPNTVCIFLISVILLCAFSEETQSWKYIFFTALRYLAVLVAGLGVYFAANKFFQRIWNVSSVSYQGMDTMGHITAEQLTASVKLCYRNFAQLFTENLMGLSPVAVFRKALLLGVLATLLCMAALLAARRREIVKNIFLAVGIGLLPVAMFLVNIMAPDSYVYALMVYPAVFLLIFPVVWADAFYLKKEMHVLLRTGMQWIAALMSVAVIGVYIWFANGCYMGLEYTKYHDLSYYQAIVTQIKSLSGYSSKMPVIFVGMEQPDDDTDEAGSLIGKVFQMDGKSESNIGGNMKFFIMSQYLGFTPEFGNYEEIRAWMEREEVREMPGYPEDGAIRIIDGTVIVKMSDYEL